MLISNVPGVFGGDIATTMLKNAFPHNQPLFDNLPITFFVAKNLKLNLIWP